MRRGSPRARAEPSSRFCAMTGVGRGQVAAVRAGDLDAAPLHQLHVEFLRHRRAGEARGVSIGATRMSSAYVVGLYAVEHGGETRARGRGGGGVEALLAARDGDVEQPALVLGRAEEAGLALDASGG
jgi:hypothetical protein